jgi:transposase
VAALEIRKDRTPTVLRKLAKAEADTRVARRILAIANALDGMSREEAARSAGMDRQTLRDWVLRYNEHGIDGLADRWGDGRPPTFDTQEQAELMHIVLNGPDPEASGLSAYTLEDLANIREQRFGKRMHPWSLGRLLKRLGFPSRDPLSMHAALIAIARNHARYPSSRLPILVPTRRALIRSSQRPFHLLQPADHSMCVAKRVPLSLFPASEELVRPRGVGQRGLRDGSDAARSEFQGVPMPVGHLAALPSCRP